MKQKLILLFTFVITGSMLFAEPPPGKNWKLVWQDDFNYANEDLDKEWIAQHSPSPHNDCSRWRENVDVKDGVLVLTNKKENRGGQDWTSGNVWTRKLFKYGYFECRYKYAKHPVTNNSFWLMPRPWQIDSITEGKYFELDINEGWYPDVVRTNVHNWSDVVIDADGNETHPQYHRLFCLSPNSGLAGKSFEFEKSIKAQKLRFSSKTGRHFHLHALRAWSPGNEYPHPEANVRNGEDYNIEDYAKGAKISDHSPLNPRFPKSPPKNALDGNTATSWISSLEDEVKFIEIDFEEPREIGCVQFLTGWPDIVTGAFLDYIYNYKVEYFDGKKWNIIADVENDRVVSIDLSEEFHTYALEWNENEIAFYFEGQEIRRIKNEFCHWEAPVWLSLAILRNRGIKDDSLDGTHMDVDYVKIWQEVGSPATMRDAPVKDTTNFR